MHKYFLSLAAALLLAPAAIALPVSLSSGPAMTVVGGYSQALVQASITITNTGAATLTLGVERQIISEVAGSENNICFGAGCYPPNVSIAPTPITLAANAVDTSFLGDYSPNGQAGITRIRYAFYDVDGLGVAADTAYVTITFDASQRVTGRAADLATSLLLSTPAPNPAVAGADISFSIGAGMPRGSALRLVDLRDGRLVRTLALGADVLRCGTVAPATTEPASPSCCGSGGSCCGGGGSCCGGSGGSGSGGIAPGGCYGPAPTLPTTTRTTAEPVTVRVSTAGLAAGLYGCVLVDDKGRARAMRRLMVQ